MSSWQWSHSTSREKSGVTEADLKTAEYKLVQDGFQLSDRELDVVHEIFNDEPEHAIASKLEISVHTVHEYVKRIYVKTGAHSRSSLLLVVMRFLNKL